MKKSLLKKILLDIEKILIDLKISKLFDEENKDKIIKYIHIALTSVHDLTIKEANACIMIYFSMNYQVSYHKNIVTNYSDDTVIRHSDQMMSRSYDCQKATILEEPFISRKNILEALQKLPQTVQGTVPWLEERKNSITATAVSVVLDENPYEFPIHLFVDKCTSKIKFEPSVPTHHGNKYEEIANMIYSFRNNVIVIEFGMLKHGKYKKMAASPDGICSDRTMKGTKQTKLVGRMIEIKVPYMRIPKSQGKLDGVIIPHYYYVQVQTQLEVTGLDECTFIQCKIIEYPSWIAYVNDTDPYLESISKSCNMERGCIIKLLPKNGAGHLHSKYIYPEKLHMTIKEIKEWIAEQTIQFASHPLSKEFTWDRPVFWRLTKYQENLVKRETNYLKDRMETLDQFWMYVEHFRQDPDSLEKLTTMFEDECHIDKKYGRRMVTPKQNAKFFKFIHDKYKAQNETKCKPLYQEPSPERERILSTH